MKITIVLLVFASFLTPTIHAQAASYDSFAFSSRPSDYRFPFSYSDRRRNLVTQIGNRRLSEEGLTVYDESSTLYRNGLFTDSFSFYSLFSTTFSGSHSGMYNDELQLVNLGNENQVYTLGESFSFTLEGTNAIQRFAITGVGMGEIDPSIISSYNISREARDLPSDLPSFNTPVPGAAWLFISGLIGFYIAMPRSRKEEWLLSRICG